MAIEAACGFPGNARSPGSHRCHLPKVTFCATAIVSVRPRAQHGRVLERLRLLLQPLNLAAILTLLTVGASLRLEVDLSLPLAWLLLSGYLTVYLLGELVPQRSRLRALLYGVEAGCALSLVWIAPRTGTAPVLLVILIARLAVTYPPLRVLLLTVLLNLSVYWVLRARGHSEPGLAVMLYLGFQAFAALIAHYARSVERARDRLARVNADLLATRALLAESARDAERLRVARELHDVAGHKLTAMTFNLRALAADPVLIGREEIATSERLASELLADIRGVVQALRDARGLDLATALQALAAPLPKPRLQLRIDEAVQLTDPAPAETVLRIVQEALTNSARHAAAQTLHVAIERAPGGLRIALEDDGRVRAPLREGNGLAGMRERIGELGGTLALAAVPGCALRIDAFLPLPAATP